MAVLITVEDDDHTSHLVESVFRLSPTVNIVVSSRVNESKLMLDKRIRFFVHEHEEVASRMMSHALTCDLIYTRK